MQRFFTLLVAAMLLLGSFRSAAQLVYGYQFQALSGTYVPLGAGATPLPALEADEAVVNGVPLGFAFVIGGRFYSEVGVSSNGWLSLARADLTNPMPNSGTIYGGGSENAVAPLWADLSGSGGTAACQTTGTAPNRVFTMEWRNFRWDHLAAQAVVSFQARLYEGSNRIEFSYRPEAGTVSPGSVARAGLTLAGASSHHAIVLNELSANPPLNVYPSPGTLLKPANGQQYSFTPTPNTVPACDLPLSYSVARLGRTTARVIWYFAPTNPGGVLRVHYGPKSFGLGSAADRQAPAMPGDSTQLTGLLPDTDYEYLLEMDCGTSTAHTFSARTSFRTYMPASNDEGDRALWLPVLNSLRSARLTPGQTNNASASLPASSACAAPAGPVYDVWYAFRATETSHRIAVGTGGQSGTFAVELRDGYTPGSHGLACSNSPSPLVASNLVVGRAYFVRVYPLTAGTYFEIGLLPGITTPPANNDCGTAQALPLAPAPGALPATTGTLANATASGLGAAGLGSCALFGAGPSKDVFYQFVATRATAEVQLTAAFQGGVEVMSSCTSSPQGYQDCMIVRTGRLGRLPLNGLTLGATYWLRVYNQSEAVLLDDPTFAIGVSLPAAPPANDNCAAALPLPVALPLAAGVAGTVLGATASALAPPATLCYAAPSSGTPYAAPPTARDVWYQFTATATTHALQLNATFDAVLEVLSSTGAPCAAGASVQRLGCALARARDPNYLTPPPSLPARLLLNNLTVGSQYWVRVLPVAVGTAIYPEGEATFTLSLNAWPAPVNDEPATATALTVSPTGAPCTFPVEYTLDGATPSLPSTPSAPISRRDVWFTFVAPAAPAGSSYSQVLFRLSDANHQLLEGGIELSDSPGSLPLASMAWTIRLPDAGLGYGFLIPGRTYYIRVYSTMPNPEPFTRFTLCLTSQLNDEPCDALPLPVSAGGTCTQPVQGTTYGATRSQTTDGVRTPVPNCGATQVRDVWYRVVPTSSALTIRCDDATVGLARLYLPTATGPSGCPTALRLVNCQSSIGASYNEPRSLGTVLFDNLTVGQPYYLAVSNDGGAVVGPYGTFTLCAQAATALPVRPGAEAPSFELWPNPVAAGQPLQVRLAATPASGGPVRAEWFSLIGQRLPDRLPVTTRDVGGVLEVPTAGRPAGLYLLRLWLANGQPLPVRRVVIE